MAKQSYPDILVSRTKKSLSTLMTEMGLTPPTGEVSFELQNITNNGVVSVYFGDQTNVGSGSTLPSAWAREEEEDLNNVYLTAASDDCYVGLIISS